jgi:dTDP-4-amino-4,6-dideoxygalactose transaminase
MAAKIRMLRDHGSAKKYYHDMVGYNYRMHGFQGAVLGVKLKYLVAWTDARRKIAKRYEQLLSADSLLVKPAKPHVRHVYHLFVVQVKHRDRAIEKLKDKGVATGIHYPIPLHLTEAYGDLGYKKGDFPVAEAAADELLSLPMYPELTDEMTDYVAMSLKEAL